MASVRAVLFDIKIGYRIRTIIVYKVADYNLGKINKIMHHVYNNDAKKKNDDKLIILI